VSNVRRNFVKRLGAVVAAAAATLASASPAKAFSSRNPGRDAKDPRLKIHLWLAHLLKEDKSQRNHPEIPGGWIKNETSRLSSIKC